MEELASAAEADGAPGEMIEWMREIPSDIVSYLAEDHITGHTYLAMQAGLWCLQTEQSLEDALVDVVAGGGDTDTNAAVAGAVLGARDGAMEIPQHWLECVPQRERLERAMAVLVELNAGG